MIENIITISKINIMPKTLISYSEYSGSWGNRNWNDPNIYRVGIPTILGLNMINDDTRD